MNLRRIAGGSVVVVALALVVLVRPVIVGSFDGAPFLKNGAEYDVRVLRDSFGVPHVYGKRDADVAFGLAYAHCEDDFATIQQSLMTSRGRLALSDNQTPRLMNGLTRVMGLGEWFDTKGADPAVTDYLVQLLKVRARVDAQYNNDPASGGIAAATGEVRRRGQSFCGPASGAGLVRV